MLERDEFWFIKRFIASFMPWPVLMALFFILSRDIWQGAVIGTLVQAVVAIAAATGMMDKNPYIYRRVPELKRFEVNVKMNDNRRLIPSTFEDAECRLLELLAAKPAAPLTYAEWTGAGNPMSRKQFDDLTEKMRDAGLAAWNDALAHSQGQALTAAGRGLLRKIRAENPLPRVRNGA